MLDMFFKYYFKCCVIIDCIEVYIEIFFSLEIVVMCWLNYKQYYIVKFLIGIIFNGVVLFVFFVYGGRVSDVFIVKDCRFLNFFQFYDEVMVDWGFKIYDLFLFY